MDRLTAIQVFLAVAEHGSFSATAEKLNLSRPMVSRYIALMEAWFNARLLHRTTRHVTLTEAGEQAVRHCQNIANLVRQAEDEAKFSDGELHGVLRLTASTSFGALHLTETLNQFQRLHPKLKIHLHLSEGELNLVKERIDLAIRIAREIDPNLIARRLAPCRSVLVATPDYLAAHGTPQTPTDLHQHLCLAHSHLNRSQWQLRQGSESVQLELENHFSANDANALLTAALAHGGIAMLPRYLAAEPLAAQRLQQVLPDWQPPELAIYALYTSRDKMPKAVRMLLDFLLEQFADKPW